MAVGGRRGLLAQMQEQRKYELLSRTRGRKRRRYVEDTLFTGAKKNFAIVECWKWIGLEACNTVLFAIFVVIGLLLTGKGTPYHNKYSTICSTLKPPVFQPRLTSLHSAEGTLRRTSPFDLQQV